MSETRVLSCADGVQLPATIERAPDTSRGSVVIAPALGVPRRFYAKFATALAARGYDTLCFDYRGVGEAAKALPPAEVVLADWGRQDLEAALAAARQSFAPTRRFLIGHSIGGQLPGLAPTAQGLDGMVFVAASAPHPSRYALRDRLRIELMWRVLVPLLGRGAIFPARRLGFASTDLPSSVVRQWAAWGLKPDYLFDPVHGLDLRGYAGLRQPVLAYSFADDGYASRAAVEALHPHYPAVRLEHRHVSPPAGQAIGHFGYFKETQRERLWRETADWLDACA